MDKIKELKELLNSIDGKHVSFLDLKSDIEEIVGEIEKTSFLKTWEEVEGEFIICSAIWLDDGKMHIQQPDNIKSGFVISGRRHKDCLNTFHIIKNDKDFFNFYTSEEGFITNKNRFVSKEIASKIALKSNQINKKSKKLFSENLY